MNIILGARGSKLSLVQTHIVKEKLLKINPKLDIKIKIIKTKGDKDLAPIPLDTVGKGWFTKELDRELLRGTIDIAVHSLKDLPESLPKGLIIAGVPEREDARDVLVSKNNTLLKNLKPDAIIGTDSIRRKVQILHIRPDLIVKSIRGNVDSRLKKLEGDDYDAVILAAAGLLRLGLDNNITEYFAVTDIVPSPGQGTLAVVIKKSNKEIYKLIEKLNDANAVSATTAERAFSKELGGGCKTPTGAYAVIEKNEIIIHGMIGSETEDYIVKDSIVGPVTQAEKLGKGLAKKLIDKINPTYQKLFLQNKRIIITRPEPENKILQKKLEQYGAKIYMLPTIKIVKNILDKKSQDVIKNIEAFDWIIFTSVKGVDYFMQAVRKLNIDIEILANKKIAVVGPKTAEKIQEYNLRIDFMPTIYTTEQLGKELQEISGRKLLLARSNIASKQLVADLQHKGAFVTDIPIYKTISITTQDRVFEDLVQKGVISYITFTSPSTVIGFFERVTDPEIRKKSLLFPVISVGPVTTKTAEKNGFTHIITADTYTTDGMIKKLQEIV